jgi:type II restriction/modification system DNA methylase subunit YeeA
MTPAEFKKKWSRYQGKETSGYAEHFNDLCRLLGQPTPAEADPSGSDFFCFQKRVIKDAELFDVEKPDASAPEERGFADVWKKDCFGWEYKGKKKNLDEAYKQLLRYREALLNPPLLVVCDFDRYIVKTNFNGTVQEVHEFTNDQIDRPENLRILRSLFTDPGFLKPQRTTDQVTKNLAAQIAEIAKSLQSRESVELADAQSRKEVNVAQKKNLRIARFLNRIVFCFFAEDTGLLPKRLFTEIAKSGIGDPKLFAETLEKLFAVMATGGTFGKDKIRYFNGHLFEDATVFELTEDELRQLAEAGEADWQFIEPSIMGTLFERALDESQRSQLGAHYTSEADIKTLVEPVLMQPFRREWATLKGELAAAYAKGKGNAAQRERLAGFQKQLAAVTVLDPACGSGNFLYVSLQLLLGLEKEVITFATQLGFAFKPQVSVSQLKAIEINPYAFELAQVSVQIGYLEWRRDNGFDNDRTPVLQNLGGFQNEDALLVPHFRNKAKTLTEAQAGEHADDDALKFYTEREWPAADVIVGNPPFLGGSRIWEELGRDYQKELWRIYENRVPGVADLCCYWFEKARQQIENKKCERAGLLATQGIRGGANREVLKHIKNTGDIFFAESDREWILGGAMVHVSMVGFDNGTDENRLLDGKSVSTIHANLTSLSDTTVAKTLTENLKICFIGTKKAGKFEMDEIQALPWLYLPNPHGKPNSDILRPWVNGNAFVTVRHAHWIIDAGVSMPLAQMSGYEKPFAHVLEFVKPDRDENKEDRTKENFWIHKRPGPDLRLALERLTRCVAVVRHSKHLIFSWLNTAILPDDGIYVFARSDDTFFGIVASRIHAVWSFAQGTQVREKESGFRYTPLTCFETFPFPFADDLSSAVRRDIFVEPSAKNLSSAVGAAYSAPDGAKSKTKTSGYKDSAPDGAGLPRLSASAKSAIENRQSQMAAIAAAARELNELRERWLNPPEWTVEKVLEFPGSASGPWARYIDQTTLHEVGRVTPCAPSGVNSVASVGNQRQAGDCPPYLVGTVRYPRLEPRDADCAAKLKDRTLTKLYNERPAWLDLAHRKLDAAVAAAYGWPADLTDEQILEKLLALNLARAAEEAKSAKVKKTKEQRGKQADELV